jgi:alpha-L-arabinofuranosidase
VDAYSDGYVENDIDTDAYIRLTKKLNMIPAITLAIQYGTAEELELAREWVEYCNGDADLTPMGQLRAARGHREPYNVKYWYLGNEISQQARYPNFPNSTRHDGPPSPADYAQIAARLVSTLRGVDPTVQLLPVAGNDAWNTDWFKIIDPDVSGGTDHLMVATSFHGGYMNIPGGTPTTNAGFTDVAKHPTGPFLDAVAAQRAGLDSAQRAADSAQESPVGLSLDEWGLGPPWTVHEFNVAHGMYGASFLGGVVRNAKRLGVTFTNYFEPVNEGAVTVREFDSELTPLGQVMAMFGHHQTRTRLNLPTDYATNDDLDFTASVGTLSSSASSSPSSNGDDEDLLLHIVNRNATAGYSLQVELDETAGTSSATASTASFVVLTPTRMPLDSTTMFARTNGTVGVQAGGILQLNIPAYGVMQISLKI